MTKVTEEQWKAALAALCIVLVILLGGGWLVFEAEGIWATRIRWMILGMVVVLSWGTMRALKGDGA